MYKKKLVVWGLAAAMAATLLAGCSKYGCTLTSQGAQTSAGQSSQTEGTSAGNEAKEKARITMMAIDWNGSPLSAEGSDEIKQKVSDYTNTIIDDDTFTWVANDVYTEKMGLALLNKDNMPMIMTVNSGVNSTIVQAANAGAFWDLTDYLFDAEKYPNLAQANKDVSKQLTVNGQLIGIYRSRPIGRYGFGYRQDWAEKLGLEAPETMEDLYNMARAFTFDDPDGDGVDNTYGFNWTKDSIPLEILQAQFGCGNQWIEKDGKLVPSHQTDEYMEALNWLKRMYDEGLVYEDWAVREGSTQADLVKNGQCGMMAKELDDIRRVYDYFETNEIPAVTGDGFAKMALMGAMSKEEGSEKTILATSGMNGFFAITKAAKTEEDLENCLHFLDKMNDEDMLLLADWGLEGITYKIDEEGYIVSTATGMDLKSLPGNGLNQTVAYIPGASTTEICGIPIKNDPQKELENQLKEDNVQYAIFNPAAAYLNNSETYALNGANMDEILKQARTQYICGEIDEAGLQAKFSEWDNAGGTKVIEEVNTQFAADK